ncbi:MAG: YoaP domain-containing protein [Erysipelotrichaceae bacterium]|nr:YoaP domain-containing protein [Erysipelotrichaceae bacterium]
MNYIKITKDNIDKEHICCAMSGSQSLAKKEWLKERFKEGLIFYRSEERGKCFIEYLPVEKAWVPVLADDYMFINCFWIAGSMKGHGYANDLLNECIKDSKEQGKKGICVFSSTKKKKEFLSDPKYLEYKGFKIADESDCGIALWYLPFSEGEAPRFMEKARHPHIEEEGFVVYYTDQCPFTYYWVPRVINFAKENGVELKAVHITSREEAIELSAPILNYGLFYNGEFITHAIQSDKKFMEIVRKKTSI